MNTLLVTQLCTQIIEVSREANLEDVHGDNPLMKELLDEIEKLAYKAIEIASRQKTCIHQWTARGSICDNCGQRNNHSE